MASAELLGSCKIAMACAPPFVYGAILLPCVAKFVLGQTPSAAMAVSVSTSQLLSKLRF